MIRKEAELVPQVKESLRGGNGTVSLQYYLSPEEHAEHCGMAARIVLQPGSSIGEHAHVEDAELYVIVSGKAMANDNGAMVELSAGDAMWTANGEHHSITNHTQEPTVMLAVVVK